MLRLTELTRQYPGITNNRCITMASNPTVQQQITRQIGRQYISLAQPSPAHSHGANRKRRNWIRDSVSTLTMAVGKKNEANISPRWWRLNPNKTRRRLSCYEIPVPQNDSGLRQCGDSDSAGPRQGSTKNPPVSVIPRRKKKEGEPLSRGSGTQRDEAYSKVQITPTPQ